MTKRMGTNQEGLKVRMFVPGVDGVIDPAASVPRRDISERPLYGAQHNPTLIRTRGGASRSGFDFHRAVGRGLASAAFRV